MSQLIELGAMTGYRAWQLTRMDMDVTALGIPVVLPHFAGASVGVPVSVVLMQGSSGGTRCSEPAD